MQQDKRIKINRRLEECGCAYRFIHSGPRVTCEIMRPAFPNEKALATGTAGNEDDALSAAMANFKTPSPTPTEDRFREVIAEKEAEIEALRSGVADAEAGGGSVPDLSTWATAADIGHHAESRRHQGRAR